MIVIPQSLILEKCLSKYEGGRVLVARFVVTVSGTLGKGERDFPIE